MRLHKRAWRQTCPGLWYGKRNNDILLKLGIQVIRGAHGKIEDVVKDFMLCKERDRNFTYF